MNEDLVAFIDGLLADMANKPGMSQQDLVDMLLDIRLEVIERTPVDDTPPVLVS